MKRRDFIKTSAIGAIAPTSLFVGCNSTGTKMNINKNKMKISFQ